MQSNRSPLRPAVDAPPAAANDTPIDAPRVAPTVDNYPWTPLAHVGYRNARTRYEHPAIARAIRDCM